ncbi:DUF6382 domain-containing protein [Anaerocolumna chitinilytica]|uniref:FHA domain-containing protein n=1 Tax=Anaerocolumna chitinilytica TaxID=1727145 RepID=A0A7I8DI27_9FIRM|nr:DUF6382 domain-containing protein [Anaerocolumna chitinilytica]BCJ97014.1 hypothetical protein bsdcttw_00550 [Anaerocolumna chitinilytica]
MEKEYIKDLKCNYLVLKGKNSEKSYKNKMLEQYTIPGLVRTEIRCIDNLELFYYDITDLKTIHSIWQENTLHFEEVKTLLERIFEIIDNSMEYFLEQDDFILNTEYMYVKGKLEKLQLCYFPGFGENIVSQLAAFFEYIMNKADYKEEPLVLLIYALYKESREKNTTLYKLKEILKTYNHQQIKVKKIVPSQVIGSTENKIPISKNEKTFQQDTGVKKEETDRSGEYEKQEEISFYELQTYILGGAAVAVGIGALLILYKGGILSNEMGEPDFIKLLAGSAVMVSLVGYVITKLFDPKYKSTKMVTKVMYEDSKERLTDKNLSEQGKSPEEQIYATVKGTILKDNELTNPDEECVTQILDEEEKTEILYRQPEPTYCLVAKDKENLIDIPIDCFPFYIGKDKNRNGLVLKENSVSRLHAVFTIRDGEVFLTDLGSTNGTHVNGQKLLKNQPVPINNSDELAFSRVFYLFKMKEF